MTKQEILDRLMPSIFNTSADAYKKLISDADNNGGAIALALKDIDEFRDYYTKAISVDDANDILLEKIAELFTGMMRNFDEDDDHMRLRYKSLITRQGRGPRPTKEALKDSYKYFFNDDEIFIIEGYPTSNIIKTPSFDSLSTDWAYSGDGDFSLAYSKSFDGTALKVAPAIASSICTVSQTVSIAKNGLHSLVFFFSSTKKGAGALSLTLYSTSTNKYWDITNGVWQSAKTSKRYDVLDATPGKYTMVQVLVPCTTGSLQVQFSTVAQAGFLLDACAMGPIEWPNVRAILMTDPEVFYNGSIKHDNKVSHNGFFKFYILDGIGAIMDNTHAAGVKGDYFLLSNRMNYPWDRVTLTEDYSIDLTSLNYAGKIVHNGTKYHTLTGEKIGETALIDQDVITPILYNGTRKHDNSVLHDAIITTISVSEYAGAHDYQYRAIVKNFKSSGYRDILHNTYIGYDGKFTHTSRSYGVHIGLSQLLLSRYVNVVSLVNVLYNNGKLHDGTVLHDGLTTMTSKQLVQSYI